MMQRTSQHTAQMPRSRGKARAIAVSRREQQLRAQRLVVLAGLGVAGLVVLLLGGWAM